MKTTRRGGARNPATQETTASCKQISVVHDAGVMQWVTDGYVAIIKHDNQEETFCNHQGSKIVKLASTTWEEIGTWADNNVFGITGSMVVLYSISRKEK